MAILSLSVHPYKQYVYTRQYSQRESLYLRINRTSEEYNQLLNESYQYQCIGYNTPSSTRPTPVFIFISWPSLSVVVVGVYTDGDAGI